MQGVLDVAGASPRRYFFEVLQHFATSELEIDRLEYFATPEGRNDLYTYNQKEGAACCRESPHEVLDMQCVTCNSKYLRALNCSVTCTMRKDAWCPNISCDMQKHQ